MVKILFIAMSLFSLTLQLQAKEVKQSSMTVINKILSSTGSAISINMEEKQGFENQQNAAPIEVTNKPLPERIKIYVNKLGSASAITEQTFAKNQLIKIGKEGLPYLEDYLKNDKRTWVRAQIARILGKIGDPSSIAVLEEASKSQYMSLKVAAIEALGEIGGSKSVDSLSRIKNNNSDDENIKKATEEATKKAKTKLGKE